MSGEGAPVSTPPSRWSRSGPDWRPALRPSLLPGDGGKTRRGATIATHLKARSGAQRRRAGAAAVAQPGLASEIADTCGSCKTSTAEDELVTSPRMPADVRVDAEEVLAGRTCRLRVGGGVVVAEAGFDAGAATSAFENWVGGRRGCAGATPASSQWHIIDESQAPEGQDRRRR